jgi:hypothetical protein
MRWYKSRRDGSHLYRAILTLFVRPEASSSELRIYATAAGMLALSEIVREGREVGSWGCSVSIKIEFHW